MPSASCAARSRVLSWRGPIRLRDGRAGGWGSSRAEAIEFVPRLQDNRTKMICVLLTREGKIDLMRSLEQPSDDRTRCGAPRNGVMRRVIHASQEVN